MPERRLFYALWPSDRQRESLRETTGSALGEVEGRVQYRGLWQVTLATRPLARPLTLDWSEFHLVESLHNGHDAGYRPLNQQGMADS